MLSFMQVACKLRSMGGHGASCASSTFTGAASMLLCVGIHKQWPRCFSTHHFHSVFFFVMLATAKNTAKPVPRRALDSVREGISPGRTVASIYTLLLQSEVVDHSSKADTYAACFHKHCKLTEARRSKSGAPSHSAIGMTTRSMRTILRLLKDVMTPSTTGKPPCTSIGLWRPSANSAESAMTCAAVRRSSYEIQMLSPTRSS
mmetsp:Transcript_48457/g.80425  ORF Transcript_48457/g.80425 Transcript_48457/m.80425 type:complete len:203 (+) Transcript_48457:176-784(+)